MKILVMDNQIIYPPESGAPLRIVNSFGRMPDDYEVTYLGVTGWMHRGNTKKKLSKNFTEEIMVLPKIFLNVNNFLTNVLGSIPAFDALCTTFRVLNRRFVRHMEQKIGESDILVSSHPWFFNYFKNRNDKLRVYDSHNCEYMLYRKFLKPGVFNHLLGRWIRRIEEQACSKSDIVLACSEADKRHYVGQYGIDAGKVHVIPNSINTGGFSVVADSAKESAKKRLGIRGKTLLFVGVHYLPNIEAFDYIMKELVPKLDHTFLIVGSIREAFFNSVDDELRKLEVKPAKDMLGYGWHSLEKWGHEGFDVRWTKKECSFYVKGRATEITIHARSRKYVTGTLLIRNRPVKKLNFFGLDFRKHTFSIPEHKGFWCTLRLHGTRKPLFSDTRDTGIAVRGISCNGNEISLASTIAPLMIPKNVRLFGHVNTKKLKEIYKASDIAINPIFSGSGLNIKVLDYMAAGIPTITTPHGARGIQAEDGRDFIVTDDLLQEIRRVSADPKLYRKLKKNGRRVVETEYDSRVISKRIDGIFRGFV
ncbi:MAG: glycosyltransferase family 4 protein [archaeon]